MAAVAIVLLGIICLLLYKVYSKLRFSQSHWARLGVVHERPLPLLGSALPLLAMRESKGELYARLYAKHQGEPYFGVYEFTKPWLVVRDPQLIGRILVKDFGHFINHGLEVDEEKNWFDLSLFNLKGDRWRAVRNKVLPTFTTGKLRGMHSQMVESADDLVSRLAATEGADIDPRDLFARYNTEVIASVAFGLDATRTDPKFREMGASVLLFTPLRYLGLLLAFNFPWLTHKIGVSLSQPEAAAYFANIIRDTFEQRAKSNVVRNDFVQLLLQLKEKGSVEIQSRDADDDYLGLDQAPPTESVEITENLLVAQAFTFLMAGFEALSSSLNFLFLELARNPEVQTRARQEVAQVLARHNGQFNYQALKEMTYLDMVINEALRLYPLAAFLFREVNKPYQLEGGPVLKEGSLLVISVLGIQRDPEYWPQPEEFQPERFSEGATRIPFTYLPFGDGPRMCIGMRFALLQIKQAMASVLKDFVIELSPKTKFPLKMRKPTVVLITDDPIYLRFNKLAA